MEEETERGRLFRRAMYPPHSRSLASAMLTVYYVPLAGDHSSSHRMQRSFPTTRRSLSYLFGLLLLPPLFDVCVCRGIVSRLWTAALLSVAGLEMREWIKRRTVMMKMSEKTTRGSALRNAVRLL